MDTALGILARSLQSPTASGSGPTAGSSKSNDLFASLFNQYAGSQAGQFARTTPLPPPTTQTQPVDSRPATDYSRPADTAAESDASAGSAAAQSAEADQPAAKPAGNDDAERTQTDKSAKPAEPPRTAGKHDKTARDGKTAHGGKTGKNPRADETDAAAAGDKAGATGKADNTGETDANAGDATADPQAAAAAADQSVADPILAVMPMAAQQMIAPKPTPGGDGPAVGKGAAAAAGKAPQGPVGKAGSLIKGVDPRQIAAGADDKAGDVAAATPDAAADGTSGTLQSASSALNGFAAALAGSGPGPNAQAAMTQARDTAQLAPQTAATQLVQAVEAGAGAKDGGDNAGLAGDGGSGGARSGAEARMPDGTQMAGNVDASRETTGSDFAGTLASVRSARPGMAAGATEQVAVQLQHSAKDGNGSISMQLRPEELGRIDIKLDIDQQGLVNATITADRPQTLELLQRDSRSLEKALQDAGLQTDSGSLSFNLRGESGQGSNQQGFQGDGSRSGRNARPLAAIDDTAPADIAVVTRRYQVANGRIDVRI